jgi:hypothetical protein
VCDGMRVFFSLRAGTLFRGKFCCQRALVPPALSPGGEAHRYLPRRPG